MNTNIIIGILIPFAGTILGAAMVFFMKNEMGTRLQKSLLGFASGVMIAASVWSLIVPSIDMAEEQGSFHGFRRQSVLFWESSSCWGWTA